MANDVTYIGMIIFFWGILTIMFSIYAGDTAIAELSGDISYTGLNTSDTAINYEEGTSAEDLSLNPFTFIRVFFGMFAFRIPNISPTINIFVSFFNYFLLTMLIVLIYRLVRSGGG